MRGDEEGRAEQSRWEAEEIRHGRCPWSGGVLVRRKYFDGPADAEGTLRSCGICDCFGLALPTTGPTT